MERLTNVGILNADECKEYGVTGPMLRAAGVKWDMRKAQPYSGYEKYDFEIPTRKNGDTLRPVHGPHGRDAAERAHHPAGGGRDPRRADHGQGAAR